MVTNIQVIFYSTYGHTFALADAVAQGCREIHGVEAALFQVPETLPGDVLTKMGAVEAKRRFGHVPVADPKRLGEADGIILGSPTRYGGATAQMRAFIDATGGQWVKGELIGKVGAAFTSTASQHGGQETTLISLATFFLHQGMAFVGVPYSNRELLDMHDITGGSPYGASTIAGNDGERMPSSNELALARAQGRHVATIAQKLKARA
jgi:NAD(P)H dehydrogenase (quinone)